VLVVAPDGGVGEFEGVPIVGMKGWSCPMYPELRLAPPRASLRNALREFKPDLIHVADPALLGIAGPNGKLLEKPLYKNVYISRYGYLVPGKNGLLAWFNLEGERRSDFKFSSFAFFGSDTGVETVFFGEDRHYIDYRGTEYMEENKTEDSASLVALVACVYIFHVVF